MSIAVSKLKKLINDYSHVNWALADQAMVSGVNFLTGILFARYLGLEEFGRFTLAWMTVLFFNSFQQTGIIAPMMSIGPKQSKENEPAYYGAVVIQQVIGSVFCFFLLWGGVRSSNYFKPEWNIQDLGLPLATALLAWQFQDFLRRYFFVRGKERLAFLNDAVSYFGQLILLIVLFQLATLSSALVFWLIAATSGLAVAVGLFSIKGLTSSKEMLQNVTSRHWCFSKWLVASALMQWTSGNLFIISLGALVGPAAVGALRAAQNVMGVTHILFQGLENVVPASASRYFNNDGMLALAKYLKQSAQLCSGLTAIFCLMISLEPNFLLSLLYGDTFRGFGYLLWWYVPIYLLISLGLPLRAGLRALDKTRPIFTAYSLMTCFALVFAAPLVKQYGASGALVGIIGTQLILQGYLGYCLKRNVVI